MLARVAVGEGRARRCCASCRSRGRRPSSRPRAAAAVMPRRCEHGVARVVEVPVAARDAALGREPRVQPRAGYGVMMWNVAVSMPRLTAHSTVRANTDGSSWSMPKTKPPLTITPRSCRRRTAASYRSRGRQVLRLAGAAAGSPRSSVSKPMNRLRSPLSTAFSSRPGRSTASTVPAACHSAAHAPQAVEQRLGERRAAEQVVVEEVEVPAGEAVDLGEGVVDRLHVERPAAAEERLLVAEVADVRAAAAHDQRVGHEVALALDEVAARRRQAGERPLGGAVERLGVGRRGSRAGTPARCPRPGRRTRCRRAGRPRPAGSSGAGRRGRRRRPGRGSGRRSGRRAAPR